VRTRRANSSVTYSIVASPFEENHVRRRAQAIPADRVELLLRAGKQTRIPVSYGQSTRTTTQVVVGHFLNRFRRRVPVNPRRYCRSERSVTYICPHYVVVSKKFPASAGGAADGDGGGVVEG